eukprot:6199266-Pleurochrysis_carterae.AAC.1
MVALICLKVGRAKARGVANSLEETGFNAPAMVNRFEDAGDCWSALNYNGKLIRYSPCAWKHSKWPKSTLLPAMAGKQI